LLGFFLFLVFGDLALEEVVELEGAQFVDEADADFATRGSVAVAVGAGGFVDDDFLDGTGGQGAAGAVEIEGAGVIEAVEGMETDDLGEEGPLFRGGKRSL